MLLFIGCLGLLLRAHEMMPDLAGLAGVALGLYGLILATRRPRLGGLAAGLGIGVAFLGNGFLPAGPARRDDGAPARRKPLLAHARLRVDRRHRACWPLCPLRRSGPLALASAAPGSLQAWLGAATASRWIGPFGNDRRRTSSTSRASFPGTRGPRGRSPPGRCGARAARSRDRRDLLLPLVAFVAFFLVTSIFGDAREANGLPLLLPLALLGVAELDSLPRGAASALDWFGMMTFLSLRRAALDRVRRGHDRQARRSPRK